MAQKISVEIEIINRLGLHARPAAMMVNIANKYKKCDVYISNGTRNANGKSIMGMMMLEAKQGTNLKISINGDEGENLLKELETLIKNKFNEE